MLTYSNLKKKYYTFNQLTMFSHSIFILPFTLTPILLAKYKFNIPINFDNFFWILTAFMSARSAAMTFNRLVDYQYDKRNLRTRERSLVIKETKRQTIFFILIFFCMMFFLATFFINKLSFLLSPIALLWILGYSFTKRFTSLCHFWLGIATALAPIGSWIAITGTLNLQILSLALGVTFWVTGFDIIYSCQDFLFDKQEQLHSIPSKIGKEKALLVSKILHCLSCLFFFLLKWIYNFGTIYSLGIMIISIVLIKYHILIKQKNKNINLLFLQFNGTISITFILSIFFDITL